MRAVASAKKTATGSAKKSAASARKRASKRFKIKRFDPWEAMEGKSYLAHKRESRGLSQKQLADAVGISLRTMRRIERGEIDDPGIRVLYNCAIALGCDLREILPEEWLLWTQFSKETPSPPPWELFFEPHAEDLTVAPPYDFAEHNADWVAQRVERLAERDRKRWGR